MSSNELRSQKRAKVMAVLAAGTVVGMAATLTLASWNESEWVRGVLGGDNANTGTDIFEVQQNTTSPFDNATANWADREENDEDAGELQFTTGLMPTRRSARSSDEAGIRPRCFMRMRRC